MVVFRDGFGMGEHLLVGVLGRGLDQLALSLDRSGPVLPRPCARAWS
jgi:hypothetical protein